LIQPDLLEDGQVCVDMGEPILQADRIPTTLTPTQVSRIVTLHKFYFSQFIAHCLPAVDASDCMFIAGNDSDDHVVRSYV